MTLPPLENTTTADEPSREIPLATQIVRGGAAVALTSYFLFGFGFLSNLVLTRLLSPADFGIIALAFFFFSAFNLRPKLGIDQAFAQNPSSDGPASGTLAVMSIMAGSASLLLTLIAVPILLALNYSPAVIWVTTAFAVIGLSDSVMGIAWVQLDKALLFSRVSLVTAIAFPIAYVPAFALALYGAGYWALVAQPAAYSLLLLVGLWWSARRYLPVIWQQRWTFSRAMARQFVRFGVLVGAATIFAIIVYQFDNFLVGTFVGEAALGFYDRAYRVAQWPSLLIGSVLTRTAFYAYSRMQNDLARLTRTATMSLWIVTTIALPLALAIFVSADDLVLFLFGSGWLPSAIFVRFLVAYSILRPLLEDAYSLFIATGHPRRATIVNIAQALAIVAAATPLTFRLGAIGTAVGVGVAFVAGLVVTYYFVRKTLPTLSLRDAFIVPTIAAIAALSGSLLLATSPALSALPLLMQLLIKASFTVAVYFGITLLLRPQITRERAVYVWQLFRTRSV